MSGIIQELRKYLSDHPDFKATFEATFQTARKSGVPQFDEHAIFTLDQYIDFYETLLHWTPSETLSGENIMLLLCLFYFVIDLRPVKNYQSPIAPQSASPWTWLSRWLIRYSNELGKFMDTSDSLTSASLATFYAAKNYHMQDYPIPAGGWRTFNEFFARKIDPAVRPIDGKNKPSVIDSPADATFDGHWQIDANAEVQFSSKGIPWNISQLLEDSKYGERFKGGIFMHSFLAPSDYHRQHAPVAGKVVEAKVIPGLCYLQVVVESDQRTGKPRLGMQRKLEAPDDPGYQFLQSRGLIVLDSPGVGLVAILPMGMAQVSSIRLTVVEGNSVEKGDEISYFQFGGSDIVIVFEAASKVEMTATVDKHYNFGKQIAISHRGGL